MSADAPLRVLAVDDEALALRRLEIAVGQMSGVTLVGKARSGSEALAVLEETAVDVLLLDIRMAGMDGFGLLDALGPERQPIVIFVTAFDMFATRAFEVAAIDYILKPVAFDRLRAALERARTRIASNEAQASIDELRAVVANLRAAQALPGHTPRFESELWAEHSGAFVRISVADILWIEADRDYVLLHTGARTYLLRDTISGLQARLDPKAFVRIRRSALVRLSEIAAIRKAGYGDVRVELTNASTLRVGRTYLSSVREMLSARTAG